MKTFLLIFTLFISVQITFTQNLSLLDRNGKDISGTTINFYAEPNEFLISSHISVKNNSASNIRVKVKKIEIDTLPGTVNYFCWKQCWPSTTYESPDFILIAAGDTTSPIDDLSIDYQPFGNKGTTSIYYVAFNNGDNTDSAFVRVNYHTPLGTHLFNNTLTNITNYEINVNSDTSLISYSIRVANNCNNSKYLKVKKTIVNELLGASSYFKWVNENSPSSLISTDSLNIASIDTTANNDFIAYFAPNGNEGTSKVIYTFFDPSNINDSVQVVFNYNISLSIDDFNKHEIAFSKPYPNPASEKFSIDYNLIGNANAKIQLHDILGSEIMSKNIFDKRGTLVFSTSELSNGIYFYSVIINNKIVRTNKIIISK